MKLEDQVCSLELAKRLKELGVRQESYFYYCLEGFSGQTGEEYWGIHALRRKNVIQEEYISAFTVAELGVMLPHSINDWVICIEKHPYDGWFIKYWDNSYKQLREAQDGKESDARAKMLIYLIENGLVKAESLTKN